MHRQAVRLGAPRTIIRRPLPSPHLTGTRTRYTGCSCESVPPPSGEHFSSYRLHVCKCYIGTLAWVVDNLFISFYHRSPRTFRFYFFSFLETIFLQIFFSFTMVNKRPGELRGTSAAFGDQHPGCPNRTPA